MIRSLLKQTAKHICRRFSSRVTSQIEENLSLKSIPDYVSCSNRDILKTAINSIIVCNDFISEEEERSLLNELEPYLKRMRYEFSHWDDAIHGYRETEKSEWNNENREILQRVRHVAFESMGSETMKHVHVLDLSKEGYIKPHVDSVRFCGDTIAGLSLVSSSVMRLVPEVDKDKKNEEKLDKTVDILLQRRSLYIMRGPMRYEFSHEILRDDVSFFKEKRVERERRISVICRNEPIEKSD